MAKRGKKTDNMLSNALECTATALNDVPLSDNGVHETRKMLKKARAGLRLYRAAFSKAEYRRHNTVLRDAGRLLSPVRDGRTFLDLFEHLLDDVGRHSNDETAGSIAPLLRDQLSQARHVFDTSEAQAQVAQAVAATRKDVDAIQPLDTVALLDGLRRIYRNARRAFHDASDDDTQQTRHELRKQTKYLRSAAGEFDAARAADVERRARHVASWLGKDHDLSVLRETIERGCKHQSERSALIDYIERHQKKLQRKAFKASRRLFEIRPKAFVAEVSAQIKS
jgi:hypothetical protein